MKGGCYRQTELTMFRNILLFACVSLCLVGCGPEDPEPPNKPEVIDANALCRSIGADNVNKLVSVTVRVIDLDGVADLVAVLAVVEATSLPMEKMPLSDAEPIAGCKDAEGLCRAEYRWTRSPDSAQVYCGESGNALQVDFEVTDEAGFKERVLISTSLQQN
jgi:hypothetical protein